MTESSPLTISASAKGAIFRFMPLPLPFATAILSFAVILPFAAILSILLALGAKPAQADEQARKLFAQYQPFIFQIRLFEISSSSKSSIGSGFQVAGEPLIATNYHVIADAVYNPDRYRIELLRSDGRVEPLKIKDVDVVHDLALLERINPQIDIVQKVIHNTDKQANDSAQSVEPASPQAEAPPKTLVEKAAKLVGKAVKGVKGQISDQAQITAQAQSEPQEPSDVALSELTDLALAGQDPQANAILSPALVEPSPLDGFSLTQSKPRQGEAVLSMGNPRDLGMTVVEGTYNGLLPHSFYSRILFSGSINPGMSGGPAVNSRGELVGINVATSGNQLSFLVPAVYLRNLIERTKVPQPNIMKRIELQLAENQQKLMSSVLDSEWPVATVGKAQAPGEMTAFIRCWGGVEDNEQARYRMVYSRCFGDDQIFMARDFRTGMINYEFYWFESRDLNTLQFYNRFQQSFSGAKPTNQAGQKHVGAFACHDDFVAIPELQSELVQKDTTQWKSILCARPYKQFPGLYDVMLMAATVDQDHQGLIAHFSLAGIDKALALEFARRFMERVSWK